MPIPFWLPVGLSVVFGGAFLTNEWSHGGLSEAIGLGHHHMLDDGGYHCVRHDDTSHAQHHADHMHHDATTVPHEGCPGGAGMHRGGHSHATTREEAA